MQAVALGVSLRRTTQMLRPEIKGLFPPDLLEKNQTMCAAVARLWCDLIGDESPMLPYTSLGVAGKAEYLLKKYRVVTGSLGERSVSITDAWAEVMDLHDLYQWTYRPK